MLFRWVFFILIIIGFNWYSSLAIKTITKNPWIYYSYLLINLLIIMNFVVQIIFKNFSVYFFYSLGLVMVSVIFQISIVAILVFEDIIRLPVWLYRIFNNGTSSSLSEIPQRRLFISQLSILLASIPASALFFGMLRGKYNYKVIKHQLSFNRLPKDFNGFKIVHISDFHCGSFDNKEKLTYGIDLINKQKPDIILFTGDMVNNIADEILPWKSLISSLNAPYGKYAVLGNHDYGDYNSWNSDEEKIENFKKLITLQNEMGFKLLNNTSEIININQSTIDLIGVENWGSGFKQKGNLDLALANTKANDFKILMSHDPTHWKEKVLTHKQHIDLTLSGHTHGMQFGIEIPGIIKWSPAKYRYKHWAGIYQEFNQIINVNRGFGFLAYPGRVGIYPEITLITLQTKESSQSV
ncbi:MAG: metallophosphoesterase [Crocinitomicaceae bacterium TMED135]|nr:MAG: metallophosphoesterase [Crocinitomicaceae bacterium TMED135]